MSSFCFNLLIFTLTCLTISLGITSSSPAFAETPPQFGAPLKCDWGKNCFILQYVDTDPSSEARDFQCSIQSYDDHKGTDFALPTHDLMQTGIPVLAVRDGTILRTRSHMKDFPPSDAQVDQFYKAKTSCGNGLVLDHGDGWSSQYCHMKQNSLKVVPNEYVQKGQILGYVGQSGSAQGFPHLHLTIRHGDDIIDPFTGLKMGEGCTPSLNKNSLWEEESGVIAQAFNIYAAFWGTSTSLLDQHVEAPNFPTSLSAAASETPNLIFAIGYTGARKGDQISLTIKSPSGEIFSERTITQPRDRIRQSYFVGKKNRSELEKGEYLGILKISRGTIHRTQTVPLTIY